MEKNHIDLQTELKYTFINQIDIYVHSVLIKSNKNKQN